MPLTQTVSFKGVVQKNRRIQIPVLIRWKHKLDPSEVFRVRLKLGYHREEFYGRMSADGRLTIPKVVAEEFLKSEKEDELESEEESLDGYTAEVTLYAIGGKRKMNRLAWREP